MARGRKPTPTPILKMRGSKHAKGREKEPKPRAGRPAIPRGLNDAEKKIWHEICDVLDGMRVLTVAERRIVQLYAETFVRRAKVKLFVDERGETYIVKTKDGELKDIREFPQARILRQLTDQIIKISSELGLSPSARARLERLTDTIRPMVVKDDKDDEKKNLEKKFFGGA